MLWAEGAETLVHTQLPLGQHLLMKRVPLPRPGGLGLAQPHCSAGACWAVACGEGCPCPRALACRCLQMACTPSPLALL